MITAEDIKKLQEIGAWLSNQRGMLCRDYSKDMATILIKLQKNPYAEVLETIYEFSQQTDMSYKRYEDTYMDGWLDACNELLFTFEEKIKNDKQ